MGRLFLALLAALALSSPAQARLFTQPELDALVAPIALYPDGLISDVLVAATFPDQVAAAAKLPKDAPAEESWDPSVKSLLSFPDILARMAESPQWTRDLGEAFRAQEPHVMDTVQSLRRRAQNQGTLKSNDQVIVQQEGPAIVVQPRTEVVYVPYYDPYVVYGAWWWPAYRPVYWAPWIVAPVVISAGFFYARPDWHGRRVVTVNKVTNVTHNVNAHRNFVNRPPAQVHRGFASREYHRVPESQRRPVVNSVSLPRSDARQPHPRPQHAMPAAPRFSESRQHESRPQQQPRAAAAPAPRREAQSEGRRGEMRTGETRGGGEMRGGGSGGAQFGAGSQRGGGAQFGGGSQRGGGGGGSGQRGGHRG